MSLRTHSLEQVVFLTWGLSVGPSEPSKPCCRGLARCFAVRAFFFFEDVDSDAITHPSLLTAVHAPPCSTVICVELDLHVKTIVLLTSRGARRRNVHWQMRIADSEEV